MSYKQQGALITILEAQKDVCLVNEAEEKSGPGSEKKKKSFKDSSPPVVPVV